MSKEVMIQKKQIALAPNESVSYEVTLKSKGNYDYRVQVVCYWLDTNDNRRFQTKSDVYLFDFPSYGGSPLDLSSNAKKLEVLPIVLRGRINPLVAKILLNPSHMYYKNVLEVIRYDDDGAPIAKYADYLERIIQDKEVPDAVCEKARKSLERLKKG